MERMSTDQLMEIVLRAHAMEIRDVDKGEQPFLYSSGNWGPGYVTIKNLVGRKSVVRILVKYLARKVAKEVPNLNFIAGNATGGMTFGWLLSEYLEPFLKRTVPFVYVRETRKKGGQKELITGIANNPEISIGDSVLVVEELINFAQTTCNSGASLRDAGYKVTHAACILSYEHPEAIKLLEKNRIQTVYLFTLNELLMSAEQCQTYDVRLIESYRTFLQNPLLWQQQRGFTPIKEGGTQ